MGISRFGKLAIAREVEVKPSEEALELVNALANDPSANTKAEWQSMAQDALDGGGEPDETTLEVVDRGPFDTKGDAEDRVSEMHKGDYRDDTLHIVRLDGQYAVQEVTKVTTKRIDEQAQAGEDTEKQPEAEAAE